jgi:hypothetical protein
MHSDARMRERHRKRRTAGGRIHLYAWSFPCEGRCVGWLGESCLHVEDPTRDGSSTDRRAGGTVARRRCRR